MRQNQLSARMRQGKKRAFLLHYRRLRSVAQAAARIGVDRTTIAKWRRKDERFRAAYEDTVESMVDQVELELMRMTDGTHKRMVVSGGRVLGEEPIHDTRAMEVFLRAHRPAYRTNAVEVSGAVGVGVAAKVVISAEAERAMIEQAARHLHEASNPEAYEQHGQGQSTRAVLADIKSRVKPAALPPPAVENEL